MVAILEIENLYRKTEKMKMKNCLLLFSLLLINQFIFAQTPQLIIMDRQGNDECAIQAYILQGNKTFIDRCYSGIDDEFKDLELISNEPIFNKLLQLDLNDFYRFASDINYKVYKENCDYLLPIVFVIGDKVVEWKRIDNCYPESVKDYTEGIIKVFEKY
jgi:hypothetical protein